MNKADNNHVSKSIIGNDRLTKGVSAPVTATGSKSIQESGRKTIVAAQPHVNATHKSSALVISILGKTGKRHLNVFLLTRIALHMP